jgi:hypothetical protein
MGAPVSSTCARSHSRLPTCASSRSCPRALSPEDETLVVGIVTMPDGTTAEGVVPLHTLRRDT